MSGVQERINVIYIFRMGKFILVLEQIGVQTAIQNKLCMRT